MSFLIAINDATNEILHPDVVKLFPGFKKLTADEVLFIFYAYDYSSPYAQFTEDDRVRRASMHVWNDNKLSLLERSDIKFAINVYKSLQYNPKIDLIREYQKKVTDLSLAVAGLTGADQIEKNLKATNLLRKAIAELEREVLDAYKEEGQLKGGATRSYLEKMQKNKNQYDAITKPKQ